jgi:hypothetical protein
MGERLRGRVLGRRVRENAGAWGERSVGTVPRCHQRAYHGEVSALLPTRLAWRWRRYGSWRVQAKSLGCEECGLRCGVVSFPAGGQMGRREAKRFRVERVRLDWRDHE